MNWVEADLPAMIAYKETMLTSEHPRCRVNRICVDLTDFCEARLALFEQVGATATRALVTTEGLIAYLTEEEVAALAIDLSRQPSFEPEGPKRDLPWSGVCLFENTGPTG